jgi:hypothetical protein
MGWGSKKWTATRDLVPFYIFLHMGICVQDLFSSKSQTRLIIVAGDFGGPSFGGIGVRTWFHLAARSVVLPASPGKGLYSQRP